MQDDQRNSPNAQSSRSWQSPEAVYPCHKPQRSHSTQKWRGLNSNSKAIPDTRPQNSHHISSVVEIFEGHPQGSTEAGRIEGVTEQARRRGEKRRNHRSLTMRGHARLILLPRSPTSPSPIYCKINTGITTHDLCDSPLFVGRIHS
jgi:hypothetical protein